MAEMVHRHIVLHVNAVRAVDGDATAEGVPDGIGPDKGVRPLCVHVQGHVIVHRIGGQHKHLLTVIVLRRGCKTEGVH